MKNQKGELQEPKIEVNKSEPKIKKEEEFLGGTLSSLFGALKYHPLVVCRVLQG